MIGYIYKIYDNTNGNVYYGSTINKVSDRIARHRTNYKHFVDGKVTNCKSFDIIKNNDWTWNIEEKVEITEKWELHKLERKYIENNECINKNVPTRTRQEYYQANKEQILEKCKDYHQANREQILEKCKDYRETNREQILEKQKQYYDAHKEEMKEKRKEYYDTNREQILEKGKDYRETNREQINERQKQYYDTNREQILEKRKATMECPNCKMTIGKHQKARHMKTKKCLEHNLI